MKAQIFNVCCKDGKVEVKGYPVNYPDFPGIQFFVHRPVDEYKPSGRLIPSSVLCLTTRQFAIHYAKETLDLYGLARTREEIALQTK